MALPEPPTTVAERWAESDPELVERLRAAIQTDGPMTFARYMATVLYDPDRGYYARTDDRTTRSGDFLTAPELHPIFGAALASQVEETWQRLDRPNSFLLREEAAGSGTLGIAILDRLVESGSPCNRQVVLARS